MNLVPSYSLPDYNRRVLLVARPAAIPQPSDFILDRSSVPEASAGKFLVRNIYLSVDPAQRGWASSGTNYIDPAPLGEPMAALAVGVIVHSLNERFPAGSYVYGWLGWQDYAVIGPEQVLTHFDQPVAPLSAYAGILGINGLTAYLALTLLGRPKAGDTVLVTTAAGAVGSVVGQLAKRAGCQTIGLTGSEEKVAVCRKRFGYDEAYNYRSLATLNAISEGERIDVFFDSTGGQMLDDVMRRMNVGGRIVQCGTASIPQWSPPPQGLRNEREILTQRLTWSGFVIFDHRAQFDAAVRMLEAEVCVGTLVFDEDIEAGMDEAPSAIQRIYNGKNRGKKLLFIG